MTLVLRGVEKRFEGFELGPIDLAVEDVTAVLGPSGSGKTTLLSVVAGLIDPDAGSVTLDGRRLDDLLPEDRGAAMVFQDGALFPHMTARENVAYAASSPARVSTLAESLELQGVLDLPATTLSGGQVQRVALARALAADPDALLLDEPLANLDAPIRRRLRGELRAHLDDLDVPVLYVTHDQRGAAAIGDRVAVLGDGVIHQIGDPRTVFERPATPFVASFTGATNCFEATVIDSGRRTVLEWDGCRLVATGSGASPGSTVRWCARPSYVELDAGSGENVLQGRLVDVAFEGDAVVAEVSVGEHRVETSLPPAAFGRLGLSTGDATTVRLPADAVHVIE